MVQTFKIRSKSHKEQCLNACEPRQEVSEQNEITSEGDKRRDGNGDGEEKAKACVCALKTISNFALFCSPVSDH